MIKNAYIIGNYHLCLWKKEVPAWMSVFSKAATLIICIGLHFQMFPLWIVLQYANDFVSRADVLVIFVTLPVPAKGVLLSCPYHCKLTVQADGAGNCEGYYCRNKPHGHSVFFWHSVSRKNLFVKKNICVPYMKIKEFLHKKKYILVLGEFS